MKQFSHESGTLCAGTCERCNVPASAAATSPLEMVAEVTAETRVAAAAAAWMVALAEFWLCPRAASAKVETAASAEAVSTAKEAEVTTTGWLEQPRR